MRTILIAGGLTAAAVAAVIGAASTSALSGLSTAGHQTVGYGSATIDGATVDTINYNVDPSIDDKLDSVEIVFHTALVQNSVIQIGFGTDAMQPCLDASNTDGSGTVTQAAGAADVTCALSTQDITTASKLRVLVTGPHQ